MSRAGRQKPALLDLRLARLLSHGTWLATAIIAVGLTLPLIARTLVIGPAWLVTIGIGGIIVLPVLRVLVMCVAFFRAREFVFAAVAALVLTIIAVAFVVGGGIS